MCYSQTHLTSTLPQAIVDWNDLPESIVAITNYQKFREIITTLLNDPLSQIGRAHV